jgi:hypothetical protein
MKTDKLHTRKEDIIGKIVNWQAVEEKSIDYATKEISKTKNPLTRMMLQALKLEAEKRLLIQQMIRDSIEKEAVNLSPDELGELSGHLNRHMETEEEAAVLGKAAFEKSELAVPRYLLSYLIDDLKRHNSLLRQFDDKLKNASIPTSATSKTFGSSRAA